MEVTKECKNRFCQLVARNIVIPKDNNEKYRLDGLFTVCIMIAAEFFEDSMNGIPEEFVHMAQIIADEEDYGTRIQLYRMMCYAFGCGDRLPY